MPTPAVVKILPSQVGARQGYNAPTPVTTWSAKNSSLRLQISAVRDHDLPKVAAVLEMPISLFRFGERECPVDHGAQVVQRNRTVHGLEIGARLPTLIEPRVIPRPVSNRGS